MMPRFDVTTIGEGQLRYSVPLSSHLERASQLDVNVTGTEANVISLLSRLGWRCGWVSALPSNPLGRHVANEFAQSGLDLSAVVWSDDGRLAIYYVEFGAPPKGTQVYYDRKGACFVNMTRDDIDWDYLLDTRLLHISGLSVPLSSSINAILTVAVGRAVRSRTTVSSPTSARILLPRLHRPDFCMPSLPYRLIALSWNISDFANSWHLADRMASQERH